MCDFKRCCGAYPKNVDIRRSLPQHPQCVKIQIKDRRRRRRFLRFFYVICQGHDGACRRLFHIFTLIYIRFPNY